MSIGDTLLQLARKKGQRSLFVVGTGKNAGKTVTMRAIAAAAMRQGLRIGLSSAGRDGEALDAVDSAAKPRLFLQPGTLIATARNLLPSHPASEIVEISDWQSAAGEVIFARIRHAAYYELAGPPKASELRACIDRLAALGSDLVIVDGAIDRTAALAGGNDAVIVAIGADAAPTIEAAALEARALVQRLGVPQYDSQHPFVKVDGVLDEAAAQQLIANNEKRQVVVRDPTQIAIAGKSFIRVAGRLQLRCERAIEVVAATVASIGHERRFEPPDLLHAVADAIALPVFDVYAAAAA